MGAAIAAAVIAAGGAVYAANQQSKAAKEASSALGGMQQLDLETMPPPQTVDWQDTLRTAIGSNFQNLPMDFALANQVNKFNVGQFLRGASTIQPYFKQNQELIGRNAASFARGELPSDVVSSIGRAAAQRGLQGGFAGGLNAGGQGGALASLNLRNLGLSSLELSRGGTQMAQSANNNAASMLPSLFDPSSMFISPNMALGVESQNANIINDWNRQNVGIRNAEATGNTELLNSVLEAQTGLRMQSQLANAQAVQGATNSLSGLVAGGFGGQLGTGAGGGYGNSFQATQAAAPSNRVTYTPGVGYAAVPNIV